MSRNPNYQNNGFYILRTEFTISYKTSQNFFPEGVGTAQYDNEIYMKLTRNSQTCEKKR